MLSASRSRYDVGEAITIRSYLRSILAKSSRILPAVSPSIRTVRFVPLGNTSRGRSRPIVVCTVASAQLESFSMIPVSPGFEGIRNTEAMVDEVGSTSTRSVLRAS